ncbi:MAG: type I 3-dehydroquinate dehydratase [Bacteroidales bacterium]
MICISIGKSEMIREINTLKPSLVEIRYDLMRQVPDEINEQLNDSILQVATCRPGIYTEQQRIAVLKRAIELGAVYVDIEVESKAETIREIAAYAREKQTHVIISYHNFDSTPTLEELKSILTSCYSAGGDVAKIACKVNSKNDSARLLSLYAEPGRKIVIGMGDAGKITRLAALELGAEFTFAAVSEAAATAPGQQTYSELLNMKKLLNSR